MDLFAADARTLVMGVLNVTPDSFSDGGRWLDRGAAVRHGLAMAESGADLVDVGGESTRPGAARVDAEEEQRRVLPVVASLVSSGVTVSIDTMRASTARLALDAGASVVNDVSGGLADPAILDVVAGHGSCAYVAMHWRGHSDVMNRNTSYDDVVADVIAELRARLHVIADAGIDLARVAVDPGIGFAKTPEQSWALLAALPRIAAETGRPVMAGASRKSFLGVLLDGRPVEGRDDATQALTALLADRGAWCLRVHEVQPACDALRVVQALNEPTSGRPGSSG